MLSDTQEYFNELLDKYRDNPEKIVKTMLLRYNNLSKPTDEMTGIFSLCNTLGIRIVAIDYKDDIAQFIEREKGKKSFIFLNSTSNYRRLRFDAATMLYCALHSKHNGNLVVTKSQQNHSLHRAKKFAATLLMPMETLKKVIYEKNEKGQYKYLVKYNDQYVIPFKNIHYIADRFGVEFATCAKKIIHSGVVPIRRINNINELKKRLSSSTAGEATRRELIPDYQDHDYKLKMCLINNMHFPKIDTANDIVKEKLRIESIKNECIIEGVVSTTKGMDKFLTKYRMNPDEMKQDFYKLSVNQRIVLGHYETLLKLESMEFTKYFINDLHEGIFKYATMQPGESEWLNDPAHYREGDTMIEFVPGQFRKTSNIINGAKFETDAPDVIYHTMQQVYYDMKYLLDNKDNYTNIEYINEVNYIANKFIVSHPFEDGNGRVSRLIMNYLLIKKGLPPFFINATKRKEEYISALDELKDSVRYKLKEDIDFTRLNNVVIDCLIETEGYFYSSRAMIENPEQTIDNVKGKKQNK